MEEPYDVSSVSAINAEAGMVVNSSISGWDISDETVSSFTSASSSNAMINLLFFISGMSARTVPGSTLLIIVSLVFYSNCFYE